MDKPNYALHWMTFWNDAFCGTITAATGYIDGGRKQITGWLYDALAANMPYDRFVAELIDPTPGSEGFSKGIVCSGVVNASQTPQMQAAQNISCSWGVNLNGLPATTVSSMTSRSRTPTTCWIYSDALKMVRCDKPTAWACH